MSHKQTKLLIIALLIIAIVILIIVCNDRETSITIVERMNDSDDTKYPICPTGYIISGENCIPDGIKQPVQCEGNDKATNGMCRKEKTITCPVDYILKTTYCFNPTTKKQAPFSQATCPAGYSKSGIFCHLDYEGKCPPNFKNTKFGNTPCTQDSETISPQCEINYNLKDGKCHKSPTAEAFDRANAVEARAVASLGNY